MYRKLKRVSTNGYMFISKFKKIFPELSKLDDEELEDRLYDLGLRFYTEEKKNVSFWLRLTMPFALITMVLMFIGIPINFLITGNWRYNLTKNNYLLNWFRAVKLQ